jgi:hypothetical protein
MWYKLRKMIKFLINIKHLDIDLPSAIYFDDTQQMGLCLRYLMLTHRAIKKKLRCMGNLIKTNQRGPGPLKKDKCKQLSPVVNLKNINMLQQTFLPFLNLPVTTQKVSSAQQLPKNKYALLISSLDVVPALTLLMYGFMFIGTQNIYFSQGCSQFFTFLCIFLIFLIVISFFTFTSWLVYFFKMTY